MSSSRRDSLVFDDIPPFPDDVDTVPLLRINLRKLIEQDLVEIERLWKACCTIGFFYLDLRDEKLVEPTTSMEGVVDGSRLLTSAYTLFDLGARFFDLPLEQKAAFDYRAQGSYFGYKGFGAGVIDAQGTKDRNEFYNTSKDYVLGLQQALPEPDLLLQQDNRALMQEFMLRSHAVVDFVLGILNDKLGLPQGRLNSLHRLRAISGDQVRWVKSPPQPQNDRQKALGEHTDFGSVTLLFNRLGGLQVQPPGQDWSYVRPLNGHCVVNLGDALVKFSAGILKSNIHRVVNPPGLQETETRMSLVYFARPEDDVKLRALTESDMIAKQQPEAEEDITAKDWILRRALGRRVGGDYDKSAGTEQA